jgi:hypothetical protein
VARDCDPPFFLVPRRFLMGTLPSSLVFATGGLAPTPSR